MAACHASLEELVHEPEVVVVLANLHEPLKSPTLGWATIYCRAGLS
ncbi:hypothetical protein JCM19236_4842 [Vibrio sp. JCM 19236]|nr:hypothetical protein JCM19236_4842 [Vibrio sp. JCM 19236]